MIASPHNASSDANWKPSGAATILLGFLTLLVSSFGLQRMSPPAPWMPAHVGTWLLALATFAMGFSASWRQSNSAALAGIGMGLIGFLVATTYSYQNYHSLPVLPIAAAVVLTLGLGALSKRWFMGLFTAAVILTVVTLMRT